MCTSNNSGSKRWSRLCHGMSRDDPIRPTTPLTKTDPLSVRVSVSSVSSRVSVGGETDMGTVPPWCLARDGSVTVRVVNRPTDLVRPKQGGTWGKRERNGVTSPNLPGRRRPPVPRSDYTNDPTQNQRLLGRSPPFPSTSGPNLPRCVV